MTREYLQLSVLSSDGLVINVPVDNAKKVGVRDIVSASEVAKVFDILRTPIIEKEMNWSRRYKLNVEKIATGDVNKIAEVVRDLAQRDVDEHGLSAGEKRMLTKARAILTSEIALSEKIDEAEAQRLLDVNLGYEPAQPGDDKHHTCLLSTSLDLTVLLPVQAIPIDGGVVIPLAPLGQLVAHEGELLAWVSPLIGEHRTHAGQLLPVIARHLAVQGTLAVHDFVVADGQYVVFGVGVHHGEGDLVVVPLAVDGLLVQILEGVVHPAHVPLHAEADAAGGSGGGDARPCGGLLGDHHDAGVVLVRGGGGLLEEVDGLQVLASAVDVRAPMAASGTTTRCV